MKRVLIADDNEAIRGLLAIVLGDHGYHVDTVASADAAISHLRGNDVDVLITDMIMPGRNGCDVIREVRERQCDIGIIAMSGGGELYGRPALEVAKETGADVCLEKPFDLFAIPKSVDSAIHFLDRYRSWRDLTIDSAVVS